MRSPLGRNYRSKAVVSAPFLTVFLLFCASSHSRGASTLNTDSALTRYNHQVWQSQDGLPQNTIQTLVQTRDGYIWLGTREGLARFDGARFTVFDKRNTEAINHNHITALREVADGSLWMGTRDGLVRLRDNVFTSYTTANGLSN